ncbi:UNKNOWN [Stylonychia lemnae]|uniref:Uncharacterized protein n=1 Tax=Stylonychia lemnae TaxID=5949 RepID=A0A078A0X3_STYLE|nr:UNKNOWN [Stylonychia lemnae]|eukprot:CDW75836.1 UNKNOWN [Stylonychia lemnae]
MKNKQRLQVSQNKTDKLSTSKKPQSIQNSPPIQVQKPKSKKKSKAKYSTIKDDSIKLQPVLSPQRQNRLGSPSSNECSNTISLIENQKSARSSIVGKSSKNFAFMENLRTLSNQEAQFVHKTNQKPKWVNYFNAMFANNSQVNSSQSLATIQIHNQNLFSKKCLNINLQRPHKNNDSVKIKSKNRRESKREADTSGAIPNTNVVATGYNQRNLDLKNEGSEIEQENKLEQYLYATEDDTNSNPITNLQFSQGHNTNDVLTNEHPQEDQYYTLQNQLYITGTDTTNKTQDIQRGTRIQTADNFVTFQQQISSYKEEIKDQCDPHNESTIQHKVQIFEAPLSTSSRKSSQIEDAPLLSYLPQPCERPQLDHSSLLKRSVKSSNSHSANASHHDSLSRFILPVERVRAVFQGFKIRKILGGRRLKNLILKINQLHKELITAQDETTNDLESYTVKQLDLQYRRKKDLFINTFNELVKINQWYRASKMSDNIQQRKRELMRSRLRNNKSVADNNSTNENISSQEDVHITILKSSNNFHDTLGNNTLTSPSRIDNPEDQYLRQYKLQDEATIPALSKYNSVQSNGTDTEKSKNRVKFYESYQNCKLMQSPLQQNIFVEQEQANVEKIVISFQEIYEQEKEKFKKLRLERSSSRDRSMRERSIDIKLNDDSFHQSSSQHLTKQKSQSFLHNNSLNTIEDESLIREARKSVIEKYHKQHSSALFKMQQDGDSDSQSKVKINFQKKASTGKDQQKRLVLAHKGVVNLDSDCGVSSKQNSMIASEKIDNSLRNSQVSTQQSQRVFSKNRFVNDKPNENNNNQSIQGQEQYYNKLKFKYSRVASKIDCWNQSQNNTPNKSPVKRMRSNDSHNYPLQSPAAMQNTSSSKKSYLKTVQVKECILITPSITTQTSATESVDSTPSKMKNITTRHQKQIQAQFQQKALQASRTTNQHKLQTSKSQENFFQANQGTQQSKKEAENIKVKIKINYNNLMKLGAMKSIEKQEKQKI